MSARAKVVAAVAVGGLAAAAAVLLHRRRKKAAAAPSPDPPAPAKFASPGLAASPQLTLNGTLLLCTQNLAVSGANQVLLNLAEGTVWSGHVILLSPALGPFAKEFADLGVAVYIGSLESLLQRVRDVRLAICNTIMTAHHVLSLSAHRIPSIWVLHEWWPADIRTKELQNRNDKNTTPEVVEQALATCPCVVSVCEAQRKLYAPANGQVVFVGVPQPTLTWRAGAARSSPRQLTLLCLGIVCPRKNQLMAAEVFKEWAGSRKDVRLLIVGARYIRKYELEYVEKVKAVVGDDTRIEVHDVTSDVDAFYRQSDLLLFCSLNEVTPMVIAEAMMRSLPVLTTNIAGIPEMLTHRVHGYVLPPEKEAFIDALNEIGAPDAVSHQRRMQMGAAAKKHAEATFTNEAMVSKYRGLGMQVSPPVILLDMDGVVVDWDAGFYKAYGAGSELINRSSYYMEQCVPAKHHDRAIDLFHSKGFFLNLPPMAGAVNAVRAMAGRGYKIMFCTSPVLTSKHCASEKYGWIIKHFGQGWASSVVMTADKTTAADLPRSPAICRDLPRSAAASPPRSRGDLAVTILNDPE